MATRFNYANARGSLMAAAMELAPTGKEQVGFGRIVSNMGMAHESDKQICIELLSSMLDGVRNDNWPDPEKLV
jgi:hypothetical protein